MNVWIIVIMCMCALDNGICLAKHGQPRTPFNWFYSLINNVIFWFLLYKAGLFS